MSDRNKLLAELLGFAHSKDLLQKLTDKDKTLSNEITKFHVRVTIAEGIAIMMTEAVDKISIMELRETINTHLFNRGGILHEIEDRIQTYIPSMQKEGWLDEDLFLTDYGRLMISYKKTAFFKNDSSKDLVN